MQFYSPRGLEFNCILMNFCFPQHWFLIDFNVIRNYFQKFELLSLLLVGNSSCALFLSQEADIAVAAYVPLPIRQQVVDFVYPYYSEYFIALYKKPVFDTRVGVNLKFLSHLCLAGAVVASWSPLHS